MTKTPTRRQLVRASAAGILAPALAVAPATATPLTAEPSPWGRNVLRLIAECRRAISSEDEDRAAELTEQIEGMCDEHAAQPVQNPADIIDRLIAAVWHDDQGNSARMLAGVLALAGLRPSECNAGDWDESEWQER